MSTLPALTATCLPAVNAASTTAAGTCAVATTPPPTS